MKSSAATALALVITLSAGPIHAQTVRLEPDLTGPLKQSEWMLDGSGTWLAVDGKLVLAIAGVPGGAIRRPAAVAILEGSRLRTASVEVELRSTARVDVPQRDLEIIVGYQSPTRFYYVHLAGITDAVHNGIFVVADADRRRVDDGKGLPQLRDQQWHNVRVEWDAASGRIQVYVNGSSAPVLEAVDTTIPEGRVGFGSFDDTGEFRAIRVTGTAISRTPRQL